jgi:ParB family chromosome partitioning protein
VKASCGVVLGVGNHGQPEIIYGLLTKEEEGRLVHADDEDEVVSPTPRPSEDEGTPGYSAALIESLTQHKTAAIAAELCQQPAVALATLVHALILNEFGLDLQMYTATSSVQISSRQTNLNEVSDSPALALLDAKKIEWARKLPTTPTALWSWCLGQPQEVLLELLSYCVARSVNGVQSKTDSNPARLQHADALGQALGCDAAKWFTATAPNYFMRVSKSKIAEALQEAGRTLSGDGLKRKKADLAAYAEKEITGTNWIPELVRISTSSTTTDESSE